MVLILLFSQWSISEFCNENSYTDANLRSSDSNEITRPHGVDEIGDRLFCFERRKIFHFDRLLSEQGISYLNNILDNHQATKEK